MRVFLAPKFGGMSRVFSPKNRGRGGCINAPICSPSATAIIVFFRPKLIGWPKRRLLNGPPLPPCGVHFWSAPYPNKTAEKARYEGLFWAKNVRIRLVVYW